MKLEDEVKRTERVSKIQASTIPLRAEHDSFWTMRKEGEGDFSFCAVLLPLERTVCAEQLRTVHAYGELLKRHYKVPSLQKGRQSLRRLARALQVAEDAMHACYDDLLKKQTLERLRKTAAPVSGYQRFAKPILRPVRQGFS